jgi:hypothetical protein
MLWQAASPLLLTVLQLLRQHDIFHQGSAIKIRDLHLAMPWPAAFPFAADRVTTAFDRN